RRARGGARAGDLRQASRHVRGPGLRVLELDGEDGGDPEQAGHDHGYRDRPRQRPGGGVEVTRSAPDEGVEATRDQDRERNLRQRGRKLGHGGPSLEGPRMYPRMDLWAGLKT